MRSATRMLMFLAALGRVGRAPFWSAVVQGTTISARREREAYIWHAGRMVRVVHRALWWR